jgi:hypothetical protein
MRRHFHPGEARERRLPGVEVNDEDAWRSVTAKLMKACAYCNAARVKLTREHVFNDALPHEQHIFIDRIRDDRADRRMPTTRDVCANCNNERLAPLDRYGDQLHDRYFVDFVPTPVSVTFEYDYRLLLGWLLKCSYNSSRSEGAPVTGYRVFLSFLLGESAPPELPVTILLGVIASVPSETPLERRLGAVVTPSVYAYGELRVLPGDEQLFTIRRVVMMQSYLFFVLVWQPHVSRATRKRTLEGLAGANRVTRLRAMRQIRPDQSRVRLSKPCLDVRTWLHVRALEEGR